MELTFQYERDRIFAEDGAGRLLAEIRFPAQEAGVVNFASTFVDPALRGQGVADALVRAAIVRVRGRGEKAVATCSYARAWFARHPEQADLLAQPPPGD